jgi:phosphatidylglycerophosphatase A
VVAIDRDCHEFPQRGSDPKEVVIDELLGQWVAYLGAGVILRVGPEKNLGIENMILLYLIPFILFRAFDILKPGPIGMIDQKIKGGVGVVLDDLVAGACAAFVSYLLFVIFIV